MGSNHAHLDVTSDTDPIDGVEFFVVPERKCEFFYEERTDGLRGLAYAVVLRALEDGVCVKWLRMLCKFYEVNLPDRLFDRHVLPERRLRMNKHTMRITSVRHSKIVLSWFDTVRISERELAS